MILRRVIKHVETQNWTAMALDFAIVVLVDLGRDRMILHRVSALITQGQAHQP